MRKIMRFVQEPLILDQIWNKMRLYKKLAQQISEWRYPIWNKQLPFQCSPANSRNSPCPRSVPSCSSAPTPTPVAWFTSPRHLRSWSGSVRSNDPGTDFWNCEVAGTGGGYFRWGQWTVFLCGIQSPVRPTSNLHRCGIGPCVRDVAGRLADDHAIYADSEIQRWVSSGFSKALCYSFHCLACVLAVIAMAVYLIMYKTASVQYTAALGAGILLAAIVQAPYALAITKWSHCLWWCGGAGPVKCRWIWLIKKGEHTSQ